MPQPLSRTSMTTSSSSDSRRSSTRPPAGVNLMAFDSRFHTTCCRRVASPAKCVGQRADAAIERDRLRVRRGADRVDGAVDDRLQIDRRQLDAQLAGDDARHVEDVFDQLRLRARVAFDGVQRLLFLLGRQRARPQHARPADHRVERRAQLVRQRREELVLRPVGRLGGLARVPLGDRELGVGILGALEIFDVGGGTDPAGDDAVGIALRNEAPRVPAVEPVVRRAQSVFDLQRFAAGERDRQTCRARADRRPRARPRTVRWIRGRRSRSTTGWHTSAGRRVPAPTHTAASRPAGRGSAPPCGDARCSIRARAAARTARAAGAP